MTEVDMFNDPMRYRDGELQDPVPAVFTQHRALGSANIDDVQSRSDLIKELTKHIPLNEYGLPQYYYRPDLLDVQVITGSMKRGEATFVDECLQAATIQIAYTQGFPTIGDNIALWGQLPFESKEAYDAFTAYLELEGIRALHSLGAYPPEMVREWYFVYYWPSRAKAYDTFKTAHHARLREQRIMNLESNHFVESEKIVKRLLRAIANKSDDKLEEMEVDKLIASLEKVTKIQRAAIGLEGKQRDEAPKSTSVEVVMRQMAEAEGLKAEEDGLDMTLLQDPDMLKKAQELIIKVNR